MVDGAPEEVRFRVVICVGCGYLVSEEAGRVREEALDSLSAVSGVSISRCFCLCLTFLSSGMFDIVDMFVEDSLKCSLNRGTLSRFVDMFVDMFVNVFVDEILVDMLVKFR